MAVTERFVGVQLAGEVFLDDQGVVAASLPDPLHLRLKFIEVPHQQDVFAGHSFAGLDHCGEHQLRGDGRQIFPRAELDTGNMV